MTALQGVAQNGGCGHGAYKSGNPLQPLFRFGGPVDTFFCQHINRRLVNPAGQVDVARHHAKQVFRVAADIHIRCAVDPDASENQHIGIFLAGVLQDFLEHLAVQQANGAFHALVFHHFSGNFQVGLVNFGEAFVDDVFVQFFLLFKFEDLGGIFGENAGQAVEHGVMKIWVER